MNTTKENLKKKIIKRIDTLSRDKLLYLDEFISKIEFQSNSVDEILAFSGSWKDLDAETLNDLTINLHSNRKIGLERIS